MLPSIGIGHDTNLILELEIVIQPGTRLIPFHIANYIAIGDALYNSLNENAIPSIDLLSVSDHATILRHALSPPF